MSPGLLLAALLSTAPDASAAATPAASRPCIRLSPGSDTHYYPVDDHTIAIDSNRRWYRLVVSPSSLLTQPQAFLVNEIRGTSTLCTPLDFDLSVVSFPGGARMGVIAQSFEPITAAEGEALRKRSRR